MVWQLNRLLGLLSGETTFFFFLTNLLEIIGESSSPESNNLNEAPSSLALRVFRRIGNDFWTELGLTTACDECVSTLGSCFFILSNNLSNW